MGGTPRRKRGREAKQDRGATLVEYALGVGVLVVFLIPVVSFAEDKSTENVERRASTIGAPDLDETGTPATLPPPPVTLPGDPPPPPPESLISITATPTATTVSRNVEWAATVGFLALDDTNNEREQVTISGEWIGPSLSGPVAVTCTTSLAGRCAVTLRELSCQTAPQVTFTITAVTGAGVTLADPPLPYVLHIPKSNGSGQNQCQ